MMFNLMFILSERYTSLRFILLSQERIFGTFFLSLLQKFNKTPNLLDFLFNQRVVESESHLNL